MSFITPELVEQILAIIDRHHRAVAAAIYGPDAVDPAAWAQALGLGLIDPAKNPGGLIQDIVLFGAFMAHLESARERKVAYGTSLAEFRERVARHPVPITPIEEHAARIARRKAARHCVGLGNKVGVPVGNELMEQDQRLDREMRSAIRDAVAARFGDEAAQARLRKRGVEQGLGESFFRDSFRKTAKQIASDIGWATGDWTRDLQRIAQTEAHTVFQGAVAESFKAQAAKVAPGKRVVVYKLPRPDACDDCVRLHLSAGPGSAPRLFLLDTLERNGTNVGRRRKDWRAVVGSTHPWCGCPLIRVPWTVELPKGWKSGQAAPDVIGPGGQIMEVVRRMEKDRAREEPDVVIEYGKRP